MSSIKLRDVVKRYGQLEVVHNIDLDIASGEFVVLLGPSGCGKTTTLRMVAGLEDISTGTLEINGERMNDVAPKDRQIAMVFQNYALYPHMTVRQNMEFALKPQKLTANEVDKRISEASRILGLEPLLARRPAQLSGGQRQRVAMGRAMVRTPQVFLSDEPLSNLDAKLRTQVRLEIAKLHKRLGTTVLYVTHDQIEAMTLADKVVVMRDGNIEQVGSPVEVFSHPCNLFVATFIGSPAMNLIPTIAEAQDGRPILVQQMKSRSTEQPIRLPVPERFATQVSPGREVTVGLRPVDLQVVGSHEPSAWDARIEVVEYLGNEVLLDLRVGATDIIAQIPASQRPDEAQKTVGISFNQNAVHLFDTATEAALVSEVSRSSI